MNLKKKAGGGGSVVWTQRTIPRRSAHANNLFYNNSISRPDSNGRDYQKNFRLSYI